MWPAVLIKWYRESNSCFSIKGMGPPALVYSIAANYTSLIMQLGQAVHALQKCK